MPNNRQLAIFIWLLIALVLALRSSAVRRSLGGVGRSLSCGVLLVPVVGFLTLVSALLIAGSQVGLWNLNLATDTGFWVAGSGSVLLFNFDRASTDEHYFRRVLAEILGVTILVEIILEISILSIPVELLLVLLTTLLAVMEVVAVRQPEHARVAGCAKTALTAIGISILSVGLFRLATDFDALDIGHLGRQALLPI